jgi:hypothetical protein
MPAAEVVVVSPSFSPFTLDMRDSTPSLGLPQTLSRLMPYKNDA